jgi:peptidyl-prolyl cis-trans isomerase A (cyclophilin A)
MTQMFDRRTLLAGGLALAATPALAEGDGLVRVAMKTSLGVITLDLDTAKAPITAKNFLRYVDLHRFDHCDFYRASRTPGALQTGIVEGGLSGDPARVLKPIAHETTLKTGLLHKDGTISMARRAPGTAQADFFICVGDQPGFDADPNASGDNVGFAAFGQVTDGMDVVRAILASRTSPTAGEGVMKGQMLSPKIPILTVRRA